MFEKLFIVQHLCVEQKAEPVTFSSLFITLLKYATSRACKTFPHALKCVIFPPRFPNSPHRNWRNIPRVETERRTEKERVSDRRGEIS